MEKEARTLKASLPVVPISFFVCNIGETFLDVRRNGFEGGSIEEKLSQNLLSRLIESPNTPNPTRVDLKGLGRLLESESQRVGYDSRS